jgi:tRNA U55 pseudouridine synthase TruB
VLLLINKPLGITSHDAISAVKKHLREPLWDALTPEDREVGIKPPKIKI